MNKNKFLKIKDESYESVDEKSNNNNKNLTLFENIIGYDDIKKNF